MDNFYTKAKGKFLITGEYFVLDGAEALALPLRFGQSLRVDPLADTSVLRWQAMDEEARLWFSTELSLPDFDILDTTDKTMATTLVQMLRSAQRQNAEFLAKPGGFQVTTQNDFPRQWGLGTSSTLIAALARWAKADPYLILSETLGGSGYDIACAYADGPICYQIKDGFPLAKPIQFDPEFRNALFFVYLGKKQNSREGIKRYQELVQNKTQISWEISRLTHEAITAKGLNAFESTLKEHEQLVSNALQLPCAKDLLFPDFWGVIKSLGAWGGDFVLATSEKSVPETKAYFEAKGYPVVLQWQEVILTM